MIGTIYKNHFLSYSLNKFQKRLPSSFRHFQMEKLRKQYSYIENPFNPDYFVHFSSNYVKHLFKGKLNKKVKKEYH